jgi:hypothetical protein
MVFAKQRERERGACSGYLMLSDNKSVSVKKFESYRCCLKKCSFHKERRVVCKDRRKRERVGPVLSGKYCEAINLDLSRVGSY